MAFAIFFLIQSRQNFGRCQKDESVFEQNMWRNKDENRILKKLILKREYQYQDWGFTLTGGWDKGQWIGTVKIFKF